jgi:signal transduction histidine kinase
VILRSFRSRLLVGSLFWTGGLLALAHLLAMMALRVFPGLQRTPHHLMVIIGVLFASIGVMLVRNGLRQFEHLRERLGAVRTGDAHRIDGQYLSEVQPLVEDLNGLLEHRERVVRRALATAGDLAHGLKTPLAILAHEAERAERAGQHEVASIITQQVERMRRQVDYHLAQARAAGSGAAQGTRSNVRAAAERLVRTMEHLHAERAIAFDIDADATLTVRCEPEDLDEMLGNLLDNACKWTRTSVAIHASANDGRVRIDVDDDGAGLDTSMRERVLQRGVRADEAAPGSGLGLAIVRDLAQLYGGAIALETSPLGGLRARLTLRSA